MNITKSFTKKLGPLPVWGWAVIIGGAGLGYRLLKGGGSGSGDTTPVEQQLIPTGSMPIDPSGEFVNEVTVQNSRIEQLLTTLVDKLTNNPTSGSTVPVEVPATKNPPAISAKPAYLTPVQASSVLKSIGAPAAWLTTKFATDPKNLYIYRDAESLRDWARRNALRPTSGYKVVNGKIVKR